MVLAGCGGDEERSAETTPALPNLTVPGAETPETDAPPQTQAEPTPDFQTETLPPVETSPAPQGGGTPAPETAPPADTRENDAPPPEDSPAERFEEFCDENPGACG